MNSENCCGYRDEIFWKDEEMKKYCLFVVAVCTFLAAPNAQALIITPQTGNGTFADGDIGRTIGGSTWTPVTTSAIRIGDDSGSGDSEMISRGFLGFDLSGITETSITNATLYLSVYQTAASLGSVKIDLIDFGSSLDSSDYDITAIQPDITSFSSDQAGYLAIDVTAAVNASLANDKVQFRLRAELEQANIGQNMVFINSIEDGTGSGENPKLDVTIPEPASLLLGA